MTRPGSVRLASGMRDAAQSDALDYWYKQEREGLKPDGADADHAPAEEVRGHVPGWWILPLAALSILAWIALAVIAF